MIPRRYEHFVFAVIQSGFTTAFATAMATFHLAKDGSFFRLWLPTWLLSWLTIAPLVVLLAPLIRRVAGRLVR